VVNKLRGGIKVAAVKAPGFGDNRKANLQDIAILTGAQVISEDVGIKLEDVTPDMLGTCKTVSISKDDTLMLDGAGSADAIEERCELIRESIEHTSSEYEAEKLRERLAKLQGGVAVMKIGGASEVEVGEKKDRVEDALNATRAAVAGGICPGGGCAILHASKSLGELKASIDNFDQKHGIEIIERACQVPARTIANNAGVEGAVIVGKLMEETDTKMGYNAFKGEFVNMVDAGVVDPTIVVKTSLTDASGVASLMITTECMITDLPEEAGAAAAPPMGGMPGGMGGMGGMPMM